MESIKNLALLTLLALGLLIAPLARAAAADDVAGTVPPRDPRLTLAEVVDAAWQQHPDAILPAAQHAQADALSRRARSPIGSDPALVLRHESARAGGGPGLSEWEAGIELPLWRPGERSASRRVGEEAQRDAQTTAALLRLQVAGEVRESVWALALAENALELARKDLATARELEAQVERRVASGDLAHADLLLARDETLQRGAFVQDAELDLRHAVLAYRRLTGLDALPEVLGEPPAPPVADAQANPYLAAPAARAARSRAELEQVRRTSGGHPVLFLGGRTVDDPGGNGVDSLQVGITFPLGGAHSGSRRAEAAVAMAESQVTLGRARRALERMQQEERDALETAHRALALAQERAEVARDSGRLAGRAFELGELPLAEYLRVRHRTLTAGHEAAQRELELQRQIARYNQALGVTP